MEMVMSNGFAELSADEMNEVDGGVGFIAGIVIGCAVGYIVDGGVEYFTGKSVGSWISTGLHKVFG